MEALKTCEQCGGRCYLIERDQNVAVAKACQCIRPCRYCNGSGYTRGRHKEGTREYEVLAPCHCTILDQRIAAFGKIGLPAVLAHADFEGFVPAVHAQAKALETARDFACSYKKEGLNKGFILSGPVGSGKTHLLVATMAFLGLEHGVSGAYAEMSLLYATIRRGFRDGKSGGEIIQPLAEVTVLAIDELGRGRGTPFELDTMDELIARRYNAGLTTLFATNYSLAGRAEGAPPVREEPRRHTDTKERIEAAFQEGQLLVDKVGERIVSRISEMCTFVEMPKNAPDGRRSRGEIGRSRSFKGRPRTAERG